MKYDLQPGDAVLYDGKVNSIYNRKKDFSTQKISYTLTDGMQEISANDKLLQVVVSKKQKAAVKKKAEQAAEAKRLEVLYTKRKEQLAPYWDYLRGDAPAMDFSVMSEEVFDELLETVMEASEQPTEEEVESPIEEEEVIEEVEDEEEVKDKKSKKDKKMSRKK